MSPFPTNFLLTTLLLGVAVGVSGDRHKSQSFRVIIPSQTSIFVASASETEKPLVKPPPNSCQLIVSTSSKTGFSLSASTEGLWSPGKNSGSMTMAREALSDFQDSRLVDFVHISDESKSTGFPLSRHTNGVSIYSLQPGISRIQVTADPTASRVDRDHDQMVVYLTLSEN